MESKALSETSDQSVCVRTRPDPTPLAVSGPSRVRPILPFGPLLASVKVQSLDYESVFGPIVKGCKSGEVQRGWEGWFMGSGDFEVVTSTIAHVTGLDGV